MRLESRSHEPRLPFFRDSSPREMTSLIIRPPYNPLFQTSVPFEKPPRCPHLLTPLPFPFFFLPFFYPHFLMARAKMRYAR